MIQAGIDLQSRRMLLADWFGRLAGEAGLDLSQHGTSGDAFTLGSPTSFNVRAQFIDDEPFLRFVASDSTRDALVARIAAEAISRTAALDLGGEVWFSIELHEVAWSMASPQFMGTLLQRLGSQTRITGWRRLGGSVLLEFTEDDSEGGQEKARLLAPKAVVKVHVAAPGPGPGHFASSIAHGVVETVGAICTFALGRPVSLPHMIFPAEPDSCAGFAQRRTDPTILTLARKGVPLDIIGWVGHPGGFPIFQRLRAALLTYDAAVKQEHDTVASILYVVAAESLTVPATPWRTEKLTKRFLEFYDQLMPDALDEMVRKFRRSVCYSKRKAHSACSSPCSFGPDLFVTVWTDPRGSGPDLPRFRDGSANGCPPRSLQRFRRSRHSGFHSLTTF